MSRYRQIHCQIWTDDKFPFVSDDCQLVFFHLITTTFSTGFGLYVASIEALSAQKRWPLKKYSKAFREALTEGFVKYNERHQVILVPKLLRHNPPGNPNVLKSFAKAFNEIPSCDLKTEFYYILATYVKGLHKGFGEAFREAWPQPLAIKEQEQSTGKGYNTIVGQSKNQDCPTSDISFFETSNTNQKNYESDEVIEYLNAKTGKAFRKIERNRIHIRARLNEGFSVFDCKKVVDIKLNDEYFQEHPQFMRPQTLFGTKMEAYLQEEKDHAKRGVQNWVPPDS